MPAGQKVLPDLSSSVRGLCSLETGSHLPDLSAFPLLLSLVALSETGRRMIHPERPLEEQNLFLLLRVS